MRLLLLCCFLSPRLSCCVMLWCFVVSVHWPAAQSSINLSYLSQTRHKRASHNLHVCAQKHTSTHQWLTHKHQRMPSVTCECESCIHIFSDSPPWAHSHKLLQALTCKLLRGISGRSVHELNDMFFFLRPTRKTRRGPPQWRASRSFCRSSWRGKRCRKRWLSLSMRGNGFNDTAPLTKFSLLPADLIN